MAFEPRILQGKEITATSIKFAVSEAEEFLLRFDSLDNPILPNTLTGFNQIEIIRDLLLSVEAQMDDIHAKMDEIAAFWDLTNRIRTCKSIEQIIQLLDDHAEFY